MKRLTFFMGVIAILSLCAALANYLEGGFQSLYLVFILIVGLIGIFIIGYVTRSN